MSLTPPRRDAFLVGLALAFLVAPVWVPFLHLDGTAYHYRRSRVTTNTSDGIGYGEHPPDLPTAISRDLECSVGTSGRYCAFEQYLARDNHTVTVGYTNDPNYSAPSPRRPNRHFVLLDGSAYETRMVANASATYERGHYPLELTLEREPNARALRALYRDAMSRRGAPPSTVSRAATAGNATASHRVDVPQAPIRVADGTYYRVYLAGETETTPGAHVTAVALRYGLPLVGLALLYRLWGRFEITHTGG